MNRVSAFLDDYRALCRKHGMRFIATPLVVRRLQSGDRMDDSNFAVHSELIDLGPSEPQPKPDHNDRVANLVRAFFTDSDEFARMVRSLRDR